MDLFQGQVHLVDLLHIPLCLMRDIVNERVDMLKKRADQQEESLNRSAGAR
jgi:hypothetical protein